MVLGLGLDTGMAEVTSEPPQEKTETGSYSVCGVLLHLQGLPIKEPNLEASKRMYNITSYVCSVCLPGKSNIIGYFLENAPKIIRDNIYTYMHMYIYIYISDSMSHVTQKHML